MLRRHTNLCFKFFMSLCFMCSLATVAPYAQDTAHDLDTELYALNEAPDDYVLGSPTAPVTLITYASVTCPHCSHWFTDEWPEIKSTLIDTGDVRMVFRPFPTAPGQLATIGFMIAGCGDAEGYFDHIEYQMENQSAILAAVQEGQGKATYLSLAQKAGLADIAAMDACISDDTEYAKISRSVARANAAGIKGVPAFFINGEPYKGDSSAVGLAEFAASLTTSTHIPETHPPEPHLTPIPKN